MSSSYSSYSSSPSMPSSPHRTPPRPCLKRTVLSPQPPMPPYSVPYNPPHSTTHVHVHFPPTPTLSTTYPTHSKKTYDRRPLVVAPNECAIPERGCPGRTYVPGARASARAKADMSEDVFADGAGRLWPPALIPDHGISSSESEESDVHAPVVGMSVGWAATFGRGEAVGGEWENERRMEFLPHAPPREKERSRERERSLEGEKDAERERELEREARRRRRREREEERGRWKTKNEMLREQAGCFDGF
ncbi:hypothetical protein K439DRAFT_495677 [Ramaria rubella]|nr:hypothetical protein K439DRAFT_495677 [Ramaria rubella]